MQLASRDTLACFGQGWNLLANTLQLNASLRMSAQILSEDALAQNHSQPGGVPNFHGY